MEAYCVSCMKNTATENSNVRKNKQNRLMVLWNFAICSNKKSTFMKNQELKSFNNIWND